MKDAVFQSWKVWHGAAFHALVVGKSASSRCPTTKLKSKAKSKIKVAGTILTTTLNRMYKILCTICCTFVFVHCTLTQLIVIIIVHQNVLYRGLRVLLNTKVQNILNFLNCVSRIKIYVEFEF